jgi:AraC family transcriptional regulator of adaptative response/methylated-DNA-[protein]-cysteine methyltransferase
VTDQAELMRAAIERVTAAHPDHPALADLAGSLGVSPHHFQRSFCRWAGISPKRLGQLLSLQHAKALLESDHDVLDASLGAGLSGPGRLHDLFVTVEAITPGEYKRAAAGLSIAWGQHPTPLGDVAVGVTERGICHLSFTDDGSDDPEAAIARAWPAARLVADRAATRFVAEQLPLALRSGWQGQPWRLLLKGTNFQVQVWRALLRIPSGRVASYSAIADAVDRPGAARAVGNAVGRNHIAMLIPCHRVLRTSGALGGYRWGEARKRALLALEASGGEPLC